MVAHSLMEMLLLAACLVRYATALAPGIISEQRFLQLCQASINCNRPLELRGRRVVLAEALRVQRQDNLTILGPGRIDGSGHSVVQVEGTGPGLSLVDVDLRHVPSTDRTEKRSLGACVFCRGRGAIRLERCRVTSEAGFGLWLVQRSRAVLRECEVLNPGRTAVAVFNVAKVDVSSSTIAGAESVSNVPYAIDAILSLYAGGDPHGVCARGEAYVAIRNSRVVGAADRACYAYMSARLDLARTEVSANDATAAAIQVEALRPGDASRLVLDDVVVSEATRGRGVSVAGKVSVTLEGSNELRGPIDSAPAVLRELYL